MGSPPPPGGGGGGGGGGRAGGALQDIGEWGARFICTITHLACLACLHARADLGCVGHDVCAEQRRLTVRQQEAMQGLRHTHRSARQQALQVRPVAAAEGGKHLLRTWRPRRAPAAPTPGQLQAPLPPADIRRDRP